MRLIIIAALTKDRVIGKDGKIPWHIAEDLKRFKELTTGHAVLMGRKTYESLGKPLPNRRNVVLTSKELPSVERYSTTERALQALKDEQKVFVIGGGQVFTQLLEFADELHLTIIDQNVEGDTVFPEYVDLMEREFKLMNRDEHEGYAFVHYERLKD